TRRRLGNDVHNSRNDLFHGGTQPEHHFQVSRGRRQHTGHLRLYRGVGYVCAVGSVSHAMATPQSLGQWIFLSATTTTSFTAICGELWASDIAWSHSCTSPFATEHRRTTAGTICSRQNRVTSCSPPTELQPSVLVRYSPRLGDKDGWNSSRRDGKCVGDCELPTL